MRNLDDFGLRSIIRVWLATRVGIVLLVLCFGMKKQVLAQTNILDDFSANIADDRVYLNWVISKGKTCNGTRIFRSNDLVTFEQIGEVLGICGDVNFPIGFKFTDENPVDNRINYYRLMLGQSGFSDTIAVEFIHLNLLGYQIRPNPVVGESRVYIKNVDQKLYELRLFNQFGMLVLTETTSGEYFLVNASYLSSGMYYFIINNETKTLRVQGKLLKVSN